MRGAWVLAAVAAWGCAGPSPCGPTVVEVDQVVDGDTIEVVSVEGSCAQVDPVPASCRHKVRYLLVDAPETTRGKMDCHGAEAFDFNARLVGGQQVTLRYDEAQCEDGFGRLLAYVSVGLREVNRALVDEGLACALFIPPAGTSRAEEFRAAQSEARARRTGMWGACASIPCDR